MSEESKMVPPGSAANADAATPKSAAFEQIYIVRGTTGEYSDRTEWCVIAFRSEEAARDYVEMLGVERQKLPPHDWENDADNEKAMRVFDPCFSEDYTGTRWWVESCDFVGASSASTTDADRDPGMNPDQFKATHP